METNVKYLVDTNVWLERLLDQEKSEVTAKFLNSIPTNQLYVSDFATHSMGVILSRLNKIDILESFVKDLFINSQIKQLSLDAHDLLDVILNIRQYNFDFDDAYQYTVAQKYDLILITFDKDFNSKGIQKHTPEEIINNQ